MCEGEDHDRNYCSVAHIATETSVTAETTTSWKQRTRPPGWVSLRLTNWPSQLACKVLVTAVTVVTAFIFAVIRQDLLVPPLVTPVTVHLLHPRRRRACLQPGSQSSVLGYRTTVVERIVPGRNPRPSSQFQRMAQPAGSTDAIARAVLGDAWLRWTTGRSSAWLRCRADPPQRRVNHPPAVRRVLMTRTVDVIRIEPHDPLWRSVR